MRNAVGSFGLFSVVAMGTGVPTTYICGDVNLSGSLLSSDALLVLKAAVGQDINLLCPRPSGIPKTGQTVCFAPGGGAVDCAGTGQDGESRIGVTRAFTDNGDGTITDEITGLMWEKFSDDESIHDKDLEYNWADSVAVKVATLNAESFAGYTDWRVPNVSELQSILNYGGFNPAVYPVFDSACAIDCTVLACSCTKPALHWTSTGHESGPPAAWSVNFLTGGAQASGDTSLNQVRAVRGGF